MFGLIILLVVLGISILFLSKKMTTIEEGYGGQIKSFRHIPITTCYGLCDNYYKVCMYKNGEVDPGQCISRLNGCMGMCSYNVFNPT